MFDILDPLNENLVPAQMARNTTNPYQSSHVSNKKVYNFLNETILKIENVLETFFKISNKES